MTQTSFEVCQHNNVTKTKKMIRTKDDSDLLGTSASEHVRAQSIVKEQGEKVVRRTRAEIRASDRHHKCLYLKLMYLQFIYALILSTSSAFLGGHLTRNPRRVYLSISTSTSAGEVDVHDLQVELNSEDLNLCHGILHSSGVRELSDIQYLTEGQIVDMGIDAFDKQNIDRVKDKLSKISNGVGDGGNNMLRELSTHRDGKCYLL